MFFFPLRLMLAVLPVFALLFFVYIRAGKRKVSMKLMVLLCVMGGVSTIPAAIIEYLGDVGLTRMHISEDTKIVIQFFLIVGVVEELGKYLALVFSTWKHPFFKHSYSAIVYSVSASLGFALIENILYVLVGGVAVGVVRAFTAVPLHCVAAIVMGLLYAIGREAAYQKEVGKCILFMILAYVVPVAIHGYYDYIATKAADSIVYIGMFGLTVVLILAAGIVLLILAAKKNHRLDGEMDPPYLDMPYVNPYYPPMPYGAMPMYGGMQPFNGMPMNGYVPTASDYYAATGYVDMPQQMQTYLGYQMPQQMPMYPGYQMPQQTPMYPGYQMPQQMPIYPGYQMPQQMPVYQGYQMPRQDPMYPDYNVWTGAMLPESPEMFYAPGKDWQGETEEKEENNN